MKFETRKCKLNEILIRTYFTFSLLISFVFPQFSLFSNCLDPTVFLHGNFRVTSEKKKRKIKLLRLSNKTFLAIWLIQYLPFVLAMVFLFLSLPFHFFAFNRIANPCFSKCQEKKIFRFFGPSENEKFCVYVELLTLYLFPKRMFSTEWNTTVEQRKRLFAICKWYEPEKEKKNQNAHKTKGTKCHLKAIIYRFAFVDGPIPSTYL